MKIATALSLLCLMAISASIHASSVGFDSFYGNVEGTEDSSYSINGRLTQTTSYYSYNDSLYGFNESTSYALMNFTANNGPDEFNGSFVADTGNTLSTAGGITTYDGFAYAASSLSGPNPLHDYYDSGALTNANAEQDVIFGVFQDTSLNFEWDSATTGAGEQAYLYVVNVNTGSYTSFLGSASGSETLDLDPGTYELAAVIYTSFFAEEQDYGASSYYDYGFTSESINFSMSTVPSTVPGPEAPLASAAFGVAGALRRSRAKRRE